MQPTTESNYLPVDMVSLDAQSNPVRRATLEDYRFSTILAGDLGDFILQGLVLADDVRPAMTGNAWNPGVPKVTLNYDAELNKFASDSLQLVGNHAMVQWDSSVTPAGLAIFFHGNFVGPWAWLSRPEVSLWWWSLRSIGWACAAVEADRPTFEWRERDRGYVETQAQGVQDLMENLTGVQLDRVTIGHSAGGARALDAALASTRTIGCITLNSTAREPRANPVYDGFQLYMGANTQDTIVEPIRVQEAVIGAQTTGGFGSRAVYGEFPGRHIPPNPRHVRPAFEHLGLAVPSLPRGG